MVTFDRLRPKRAGWLGVASAVLVIGMSFGAFGAEPAVATATATATGSSRSPAIRWVHCTRKPLAKCGYITVMLDRRDPSVGTIDIFFELYPRSDASEPSDGTIVAVEGGPGYSTTASRWSYLTLFAPLHPTHDLLLMDLRGTGKSGAIDCKALQSYEGNYDKEVGRCGRQLGDAADLYGSHNASDDMADLLDALGIAKVDLYGDSYGTFYSQTFAVRHPDRVRTVVLDSAYSVQWPDPWYSDTNPAMVNAFRFACMRWPTCSARGDTMNRILDLLTAVRKTPISGDAPDGGGVIRHVTIDPGTVGQLMADAATNPTIYRELDAAIRAALGGSRYTLPLLRLLAENTIYGDAGPVRQFSEGLYVAVSCNDYPQAYDMTKPPSVRARQYANAIAALKRHEPVVFWPFTVDEWVNYPEHYWDSCLRWPVPSRVDPPVPPDAAYPKVPVLVLSGDLDSLTSPEGALATAARFPDSTFVSVANSTHVTALGDFDRCASRIVLRFVTTKSAGDTSCAAQYGPNRLADRFVEHAGDLGISKGRRRAAVTAADTVADVIARWWAMSGTEDVGLRGGTFTSTGYGHVRFGLTNVKWVDDVTVSGTIDWDRRTGAISASVTVDGSGAAQGTLTMSWSDWAQLPYASVSGVLDGHAVSYSFLAP